MTQKAQTYLDRFAAPEVDECERKPVAGDKTSHGEYEIARARIHQLFPSGILSGRSGRSFAAVPNGAEHDGRVQAKAVDYDTRVGRERVSA